MDHNAKKYAVLAWAEGGGADLIFKYKIGLIFRPSYPRLYKSTCNMWKYSNKDFRAFDEVFADTVEVAA